MPGFFPSRMIITEINPARIFCASLAGTCRFDNFPKAVYNMLTEKHFQ